MSRIVGIALVAGVGILFYIDDRYLSRVLYSLQDLGHPIAFGLSTWLILTQMEKMLPDIKVRHYCIVALLFGTLGVLIEVTQPLAGRSSSVVDFLGDVLGVASVSTLHASARRPNMRFLLNLRIVVYISVVIYAFNPALRFLAELRGISRVPLLANFDGALDSVLWQGGKTVYSQAHSGIASYRVHLTAGTDSKVMYFPPAIRWDDYKGIRFSLLNSGAQPLPLQVRFHPRVHSSESGRQARLLMQFNVQVGGANWETIGLNFRDGLAEKLDVDLREIYRVTFRFKKLRSSCDVFIDDISLVE